MANYAIGDIQGCFDSLQQLLNDIQFNPLDDTLWIAGDLVNRGPKSLQTLLFLKSLGSSCKIVLGNHDLHMIAVYCQSVGRKNKDTFEDVLDSPQAEELINWLCQQALMLTIDINKKRFLLSHAGIPPIWSAEQALGFSREVESILQSSHRSDFLSNMYGNEPDSWHKGLQGHERLRVITNYFTRMRFCSDEGALELNAKSFPSDAPKGFRPWYAINNPQLQDEKIIFGHWAALQGKTQNPNFFAIDTGCVWGEKLTALRLEDEQLFSCDAVENLSS